MKNIIRILLCFVTSFTYAQYTPRADGSLMRDTGQIVYNEDGKIIKYSDYKNLLASGEYIIVFAGDPLAAGTKQVLRKLTPEEKQRRQEGSDPIISNTRVLSFNSQLDAAPLALALQKDLFSNKAILMVFSNPDCTACSDMFAQINSTIGVSERIV